MIALDLGITTYTDRYLLSRDVSVEYARTLRARIEAFCQWANADVPIHALTCELVNEWLGSLSDGGMSAWSLRGYRGALLTVWNAAFEAGDNQIPPLRLRRVRKPTLIVEAYTHAEIRKLLRAAGKLRYRHCDGNRAADFWRAAIHVGYCCGPRRGDLLRIEWRQVSGDVLTFAQHKTGFAHTVLLSADALKFCRKLRSDGKLLPWPHNADWFSRKFTRLRISAGVTRGSFKWIRRSAGSYAEREQSGAGSRLLGHRDPAMFHKHYEDRSITRKDAPCPPPLQ